MFWWSQVLCIASFLLCITSFLFQSASIHACKHSKTFIVTSHESCHHNQRQSPDHQSPSGNCVVHHICLLHQTGHFLYIGDCFGIQNQHVLVVVRAFHCVIQARSSQALFIASFRCITSHRLFISTAGISTKQCLICHYHHDHTHSSVV
jgi:hypothetical protein